MLWMWKSSLDAEYVNRCANHACANFILQYVLFLIFLKVWDEYTKNTNDEGNTFRFQHFVDLMF